MENSGNSSPGGIEIRMLKLFQRLQHLELGKIPNQGLEITMSQMQLIRFVGENPECHLQDVADGMNLSSPTVSVSIRRLEDMGLIERKPDPEDGRAACLTLTDKSQKAFQQVRRQMFDRVQTFLSHLNEEEQSDLLKLMEKAVAGLEATAKQTK
jgi:DNA-binding MarR family transcriptional regulator